MNTVQRKGRFAVFGGERVRSGVSNIISHLHQLSGTTETSFGLFHCLGDVFESYGRNDISIVCISASQDDRGIDLVRHEFESGRPCGVIMDTENRNQWDQLREIHAEHPLLFLIAPRGPKETLSSLFRGITVESKLSDLDPPYDRMIAEYIWGTVSKLPFIQPTAHAEQDIGPIPPPYASN